MPGRIYTIYTQFDQKFMPGRIRPTGRISNSTGHEILVKLGVNSCTEILLKLGVNP